MNSERPGSRLPADPAYWDELATRSVNAAIRGARPDDVAAGADRATAVQPWWHALSHAAAALAASAVLALIAGTLLDGERPARPNATSNVFVAALAPDDPLLRTVLDEPVEPAASAMLRLLALREVPR